MQNIKQVVVMKDSYFYGLGEDNKMYIWNHATCLWDPYWNTGEPSKGPAVFIPGN